MRPAIASAAILLAGCEPAGNEPGPGGVTMDEARALDEAAEMLEGQRLPDEALPPEARPDPVPELPPEPPIEPSDEADT